MSETSGSRGQTVLVIALVVGALFAYGWLSSVIDERNDLRDRFSRLSRDYSAATARGDNLEERLTTLRAAVPKAREQSYQNGRRDAIRDTCNAIYGSGPTLEGVVLRDGSIGDTWSRSAGELAIIRAIVVVVSLEDGSSERITRSDCMRRERLLDP